MPLSLLEELPKALSAIRQPRSRCARRSSQKIAVVALAGSGLFFSGWRGARAQELSLAPVQVVAPAPSVSGSQRHPPSLFAELPDSSGLSFSSSAMASGARMSGETLPDAPDPQTTQTQGEGDRAPSTKRILGIVPNFRTVSTDEHLPPQTAKEKFITATQDSFDYSSIFIPAAIAGYSLGTNADPEFGGGGLGYGRYLWHAVVDQTSENYLVEAIFPSITHEDSRFYTQGRGDAAKRAGYALTRVIYTRSDAGLRVFNISEVIGSGTSAGLSTLYYPSRERSFGDTGKQWGLDIGIDAISFMFKEFWPDINQKLFGVSKAESTGKP